MRILPGGVTVAAAAAPVSRRRTSRRCVRAFSALEILVVMSIIAVLAGLILPAISKTRRSMRKLTCASNMRTLTMDFQFFADGTSEDGQGDSERLGRNRFYINDFQDSQYQLDEFWDAGAATSAPLRAGRNLMLCPEGPGELMKQKGYPCGAQAIQPAEDVTIAVNMRLQRAVVSFGGNGMLAPAAATRVTIRILDHPYVPLLIDVDGIEATRRGIQPFYTAPPRPGSVDPYSNGHYWVPSDRHGGMTNVVFVGGHVLSSEHPADEDWNWDYQASVGN